MPPNRKGAFVDSLATLNVSQFVETSKFPSLTAQPPQQQQHKNENIAAVTTTTTTTTTEQPVRSAEDLANRAIIDRVLQEERLRIQFSADHILESILLQQQRQEEEKEEETVVRREKSANDNVEGYWDMPAIPTKNTVVRARNNNDAKYWEWPSTLQQQKEATIRHILQAEKQRQLFSIEHLEQNLLKEAVARKGKGEQQQQQVPANDSYWQWEANNPSSSNDTTMSANEKAALIESILVDEQARQLLSLEHLEQNLTSTAVTSQSTLVAGQVDDDYWAGF